MAMAFEWPDKVLKSTQGAFYGVISGVLITQFLFTFALGVNDIALFIERSINNTITSESKKTREFESGDCQLYDL